MPKGSCNERWGKLIFQIVGTDFSFGKFVPYTRIFFSLLVCFFPIGEKFFPAFLHGGTFWKGREEKEEEEKRDGGLRRGGGGGGREPLSLCRAPTKGGIVPFFSTAGSKSKELAPSSSSSFTEKNRASKQNFYHQSTLLTHSQMEDWRGDGGERDEEEIELFAASHVGRCSWCF